MRSNFVKGFEKSAGVLSTTAGTVGNLGVNAAKKVGVSGALNLLGNVGDAAGMMINGGSKMSKARNGIQAMAGSYV